MSKQWIRGGVVGLCLALAAPVPVVADDMLDQRNLVVLRPGERVLLLKDMRNYLRGVQALNLSLAREDFEGVEQTARALGRIAIYDMKPHMTPSLVPTFRRLAVEVHEGFEQLADTATTTRDSKVLLESLGQLMDRCIACHDTFRVGDY